MPIECVWMGEFAELPPTDYVPGWTFFGGPWAKNRVASNEYKRFTYRKRAEICVILPDRRHPTERGYGFCVDSAFSNSPEGEGWYVECDPEKLRVGERPPLTVMPSINVEGVYHGFITDGIIHDDLP